ncbi:amidase signature domain-containing protein [Xylariaceae sp. FL1651]|nr:amidase signature domain-containing protein [Xylariaceae sp. FL1651]
MKEHIQPIGILDTSFSSAAVIRWPDDDFVDSFLHNIILAKESNSASLTILSDGIVSLLNRFHRQRVWTMSKDARATVLEGPYFIRSQNLHRTWKLFPDIYEAFQLPTIQSFTGDEFQPFTYLHEGNLMIPVPSKLHFPKTPDKPYNGLRVTVKDIIDLKGVKTAAQSRSYEKLYPPRSRNAYIVSRLIDLGAVIIGKTKCTQFASSDQPTADWVDYRCSWNPGGDGYLSPRGSSTGTCVALAGYDWVELGIGSDTGGSIRGPAAVMGLFALRPTHALTSMDGILPIISSIDTPGVTCRDISLLHDISKDLFDIIDRKLPSAPTKLLYPKDYWDQWSSNNQMPALDLFLQKLEEFLGFKRTVINLSKKWANEDPAGNGVTIEEYLSDTFMSLLWRGYHDEYQVFRNDYNSKFGVSPYVHPTIQYCWERGSKVSEQELETAKQHKAVYKKWLRESVLDGDDFKTIMVFPAADFKPFYRDAYRKAPDDHPQPYNWSDREDHQSSLAGIPNIVIPVGQVLHQSKITGGMQELPTAVHVISGAGK